MSDRAGFSYGDRSAVDHAEDLGWVAPAEVAQLQAALRMSEYRREDAERNEARANGRMRQMREALNERDQELSRLRKRLVDLAVLVLAEYPSRLGLVEIVDTWGSESMTTRDEAEAAVREWLAAGGD